MKFIIYGYMRSGTTMLTTMLNSHSKLKCYAEESVNVLPSLNNNEGINVKYPHLKQGEILNYVNNYKIIHLIRTNVFNTAISNYINDNKQLTKTPTAHIFSKNENLHYLTKQDKHDKQVPFANKKHHKNIEIDKIFVDVNYVRSNMQYIHNQITTQLNLLMNYSNVLTLTYEELTSDNDVTNLDENICKTICNFLDIEYENMYPTTMKVNDSNYEKYILNWNDLKDLKLMME